ncbi:hypothetical protein RND71_000837 [Anisodus tanguticus]|uniref:Uncharacterized protein n=1 Tax=Anisodus tanguticus TaxID=243964 RepID=A0AAE1SZ52_9SOLA|nr:hypothetical protein RND71_000837 [Anisodus tanguticus]
MVGPVGGLFLVEKWRTEYDITLELWNPATRVVTTLPAGHFQLQPFFSENSIFWGFGLDPFPNNYKVIWVRNFWDKITGRTHNYLVDKQDSSEPLTLFFSTARIFGYVEKQVHDYGLRQA